MPNDSGTATGADDFLRAVAAAKAAAAAPGWLALSASEQTRAIYAQLRLIDAARVEAQGLCAHPQGRFRIAGTPTGRKVVA
ncbi:MAG TPA: hypothetical protein VMU81_21320 [Acetobacteraceae bacterium]|nr:hypothetical protein [Acetobacteraceae bacterium]